MQKTAKGKLSRLEEYYLITNIKGFLTLLIVFYHLISVRLNSGAFNAHNVSLNILPIAPVFVAGFSIVPIFIIITGFYSKNTDACRNNAFSTTLVPYIILQIVSMAFFGLIIYGKMTFNLFMPCYQLWYLLSLFFWQLTLKDVVRIKGGFWILFIASLLVGVTLSFPMFAFDEGMGVYMSLFHTVAFYPYLLIGYFVKSETIARIRNTKLVNGLLLIALFLIIGYAFEFTVISVDALPTFSPLLLKSDSDYIDYLHNVVNGQVYGLNSYVLTALVGIVYKLVQYISVILLSIAAIRFFPAKKIPFLTKLGAASITVYCLHTFVAIPIGLILPMDNLWIYFALVTVLAFAISWLFSLNAINKRYTKFFLFIGEKIMKKPAKTEK